jgi:phthiodiolone/phenolphthiodiolone dimycocerosates ketoreductase
MTISLGVGVLPTNPLSLADMIVERSDEIGIDIAMVPDHLMAWFASCLWPDVGNIADILPSPHVFHDPFPLIAMWAERTERLRFATAVTDPIRRPPAQLAVTALTMGHLTEGRFVLGLGCGEAENLLPYGLPFDHPASRLEEALRIIRAIWTEERVDYDGRFWKLRSAVCDIDPFDDRVPEIWIGAHGPRMLEITGRYADGWLPFMPFTPEEYAKRLLVVRAAAEQAGRDPMSVTAALNTPVCIADTHEQAHAMLASAATGQFLLAMNDDFYTELGQPHPLGISQGVAEYIPEWLTEAELRSALAEVPDPMVAHDLIIHGTPAEVASQLAAFEEAGLQHLSPLDTSPFTDIRLMKGWLGRLEELQSLLKAPATGAAATSTSSGSAP